MDFRISASTQRYLLNLGVSQQRLQKVSAQVSSGLRLTQPSDDPAALGQIYTLQSQLAANGQTQKNLQDSQTDLTAADTALQSALSAVSSAISLSSQGMSSNLNLQDLAALAVQVAGLQQTMVSLSQANVNGKYVFSGDQGDLPTFQYDPTQPTGVVQLAVNSATRVLTDVSGASIATAETAQEIFDARDTSGNPAAGNVFAALNDLHTALVNGDRTAVVAANAALQQAQDYLNQRLVFYGTAENRVSSALDLAKQFQLAGLAALRDIQDTDIPSAAAVLAQAQTQQQATFAVEGKLQQQPNLFSYLG